ncbi:MAG: DegV family protein [Clostridiales bacterium]|jgi:DegV family protein with EDD domain|nr:DegV family protein [Clostridiales bacterium]
MHKFAIFSDSSCDLSRELLDLHGISLVHYYVTLDAGINYLKEYQDIEPKEFYRRLEELKGVAPKTSLPPIQDYIDAFKPAMEAGEDILCLCLTQKFSGSYQSAHNAAEMLKEEFPDRTVRVVDTKNCSTGQGLAVLEAARMKADGFSLEETAKILKLQAEEARIMITVDNLDYLQRGGRIGKVTAFAGALLNIKPVISMTNGELVPISRIRGRQKAIAEVAELAAKDLASNESKYHVAYLHSNCPEDLVILRAEVEKRTNVNPLVPVGVIGVTIGTHIGPTAVAFAYTPKYECFLEK